MHESLCLCGDIPSVKTLTRVIVVVHHVDERKPSNTGRLATRCLTNSELVLRGASRERPEPLRFEAGLRPLVLFPYPDAHPLELFVPSAPVALIVPDGSWRQASKVKPRVPGLASVPAVRLPPGAPSRYRLRRESFADRVSTIEAIARALALLGEGEAATALERVFSMMVDRLLWTRGEIATEDVAGGIPEGAKRHEPRGPGARGR